MIDLRQMCNVDGLYIHYVQGNKLYPILFSTGGFPIEWIYFLSDVNALPTFTLLFFFYFPIVSHFRSQNNSTNVSFSYLTSTPPWGPSSPKEIRGSLPTGVSALWARFLEIERLRSRRGVRLPC